MKMPPKASVLSFIVSLPEIRKRLDAAVAWRDAEESVRRRRSETFAIGKNCAHELAAACAVLQRVKFDRDLVARLDAVGTPSCPRVLCDRLHLERPFEGFTTRIGHHH